MKLTNNKRVAASVATAALMLAMPISALANYGPDRTIYACGTLTHMCQGANHVQFNSFKNGKDYGDERNFVMIRPVGGSYSDSVKLVAGQDYEVQAYVHNNADPALVDGPDNYNAKNTTFKVTLPSTVNGSAALTGYISASNATPGTVYDDVTLTSDSAVNVALAGPATFTNSQLNNVTLGNITSGALLGFRQIDGVFPGCFEFAGYVHFKIHVAAPGHGQPPITPASVSVPKPTPAPAPAPAALPSTGASEFAGLAGLAGTGAMGYTLMQYRKGRKALAEKLLHRK